MSTGWIARMKMIPRIKILLVVRLISQTISRTSLPFSQVIILFNRVNSEMAEASAWDALVSPAAFF